MLNSREDLDELTLYFPDRSCMFSYQPWAGQYDWTLSSHACMRNCFSHVWLFVTPWTVSCQAPLSLGFSRQEYWSGLPCPPPGGLPDPGIKPVSLASPALQADSLPAEPRVDPSPEHLQSDIYLPVYSLFYDSILEHKLHDGGELALFTVESPACRAVPGT